MSEFDWPSMSGRERLVVVVSGLAIASLLLWPIRIERSEVRQVEFAWELYAKGALDQSYVVVIDGVGQEYQLADLLTIPVAEVEYEDLLPPWLCLRFPEADSVDVTFAGESWTVPC